VTIRGVPLLCLFLDSIQEFSLVGLIASLKGSIQVFKDGLDEFDEGDTPLPTHLTINGIVTTMSTTTSPITTSLNYASSNATNRLQLEYSANDVSVPNIQGAYMPRLHVALPTVVSQTIVALRAVLTRRILFVTPVDFEDMLRSIAAILAAF
jgi:hypothetical protein